MKKSRGRPAFNFTEEMDARISQLMNEYEMGSLRILKKLRNEGFDVPSRKTLWSHMQKLKINR